jgi:hypothetical protein
MSSKDSSGPKPGPGPAPVVINKKADLFSDSVITLDPKTRERMKQAAPEVSQGSYREVAFRPRGTLSREDVVNGFREGVKMAGTTLRDPVPQTCNALKAAWLPFLRQTVEQAGGDGLDGVLGALMKTTPRKPSQDPLVPNLLAAYDRLNRAPTPEALMAEAEKIITLVSEALGKPDRRKLSLKVLEKELEGRMAVDEILGILVCSDQELADRLGQVRGTIDRLREEIRGAPPGAQPSGLLWNFTRFKAERIVIEAEQRRRAAP